MAERRMFAKSIVLSDAFLDMPISARCLYFTLGMLADDDGFVGNPKSIMRQCGSTEDDMKLLLAKRYVLGFESGIVVIKHWLINNYLQNDRRKDTTYLEEKETLTIDKKGAYTERNNECIQNVYKMYTQVSIGKDSIVKDKEKESIIINNNTKEKDFFDDGNVKEKVVKSKPKKEKTELDIALAEFVKMRNKIKKPLTDRALNMIKNKLDKLASDDETKIAILNQSIINCWQDIYELKDSNVELNPKEEKEEEIDFEEWLKQ